MVNEAKNRLPEARITVAMAYCDPPLALQRHSQLRCKLLIRFVRRHQFTCTGNNLFSKCGTLLALEQASAKIAVLGKALLEFVGACGMIGVRHTRLNWCQVMRLSEKSRDGMLRKPGGITVVALFHKTEQDERVVREGVKSVLEGVGFRACPRGVQYFADAVADKFGHCYGRGWMNGATKWVSPPPTQRLAYDISGIHFTTNLTDRIGRNRFHEAVGIESVVSTDLQ